MVEVNWVILLSQAATFLVALFIVWKFAWKGLIKMMNDRQESIRKSLEQAETTRQVVAKLEDEYREKIKEVETKAEELVALAKLEAIRAKDEIIKAAQDEAIQLRERSKQQLEQERQVLVRELRTQIVNLSMSLTEKVLHQSPLQAIEKTRFEDLLGELTEKEPQRAG